MSVPFGEATFGSASRGLCPYLKHRCLKHRTVHRSEARCNRGLVDKHVGGAEADRPDRGQLCVDEFRSPSGAILAAAQGLFDGIPIGRTVSIMSPMTGPRRRWASPASQSARNSGAPSIYHNSTQNSCGGPEIVLLERHRKFVGTAKIGVEGSNGGMPRVQCRATVPVATICPAGWDFARGTVVIDGRRLSPFT
jgi:hypothetical protein